ANAGGLSFRCIFATSEALIYPPQAESRRGTAASARDAPRRRISTSSAPCAGALKRSADRPGVAGVQELREVALALLAARALELLLHQAVVGGAVHVAEDADRRGPV